MLIVADLVPLTFKASQEFSEWLSREYGYHDMSRSDFVRQCIRVAAPLLREAPALFTADDKRIADAMEKVGKTLVILDIL